MTIKLGLSLSLVAELEDMPQGTGTLFVTGEQDSPTVLTKENRCLNLTEREECLVVQYLAATGGDILCPHPPHTTTAADVMPRRRRRRPDRVLSGVHAGWGQLSFGRSYREKADLCLVYYNNSDSVEQED